MKKMLLSIGMLILVPHAAAEGLYDRIIDAVRLEHVVQKDVDPAVAQYIIALLAEEGIELNAREITDILQNKGLPTCSRKKDGTFFDCAQLLPRVKDIARNEQAIRNVAAALQATASSYEIPISDLPGRSLQLSSNLRGILSIWSTGTGSVSSSITGALIRSVRADPAIFKPLLTNIGERLETMTAEERTAAVWRYQYGVRLVRGDREPRFKQPTPGCDSEQNTERQLLWKCFGNLEDDLLSVWDATKHMLGDTAIFTTPLERNETAYITFDATVIDESLPDNVLVWARIDGDAQGNFPMGDIGLQWETPLLPVLPSLLTPTGKPIVGGEYPPEPVQKINNKNVDQNGMGLCTNPVSLRGYLCRPFVLSLPEERCPLTAQAAPDEIRLTHCEQESDARFTAAGPDVCRDIGWKNTEQFNPNERCSITLSCSQRCTPGIDASAVTNPKDGRGNIPICVNEESAFAATYLVYHELVHAYQKCSEPVGFDPMADRTPEERNAICCSRETEAYRAQCDMMERDGVFADVEPVDGIAFNAETCTEAWANFACGAQQGFNGCYVSRTYTAEFLSALEAASGNNPKNVPATCSSATHPNSMDQRVRALKESIELRDDVCRPGNQTTYKNRIGNNLCYIGQCIEQSVEQHRITPGFTPATVGDEESPWNDPRTGTPLGNVLMNPPLSQARIPSYRPKLLVREAEIALCEALGFPPSTPPILCTQGSDRILPIPQSTLLDITHPLENLQQAQNNIASDLLTLSPSLGNRVGTDLYVRYLRESNRSFAGILTMAVQLLQEIRSIDFPTLMCTQ